MSELKPCAWCGAPAELVPDEDGSVFIECDHLPWCVFTDSDTRMWFYGEDAFNDSPAKTAYEVASEAWNRRAERTCRMVDCGSHDTCVVNRELTNGDIVSMEFGYKQCSECGANVFDCPTVRYCPSCGAKVAEE